MDKFILLLRWIGQDELFWEIPVAEAIDSLAQIDLSISSFLAEHCIYLCIYLVIGFIRSSKDPSLAPEAIVDRHKTIVGSVQEASGKCLPWNT